MRAIPRFKQHYARVARRQLPTYISYVAVRRIVVTPPPLAPVSVMPVQSIASGGPPVIFPVCLSLLERDRFHQQGQAVPATTPTARRAVFMLRPRRALRPWGVQRRARLLKVGAFSKRDAHVSFHQLRKCRRVRLCRRCANSGREQVQQNPFAVGTELPRAPHPDPYVRLSRVQLLPWV